MVNFKYFFIIFSFLFLSNQLLAATPAVDSSKPTTSPGSNTSTNKTTNPNNTTSTNKNNPNKILPTNNTSSNTKSQNNTVANSKTSTTTTNTAATAANKQPSSTNTNNTPNNKQTTSSKTPNNLPTNNTASNNKKATPQAAPKNQNQKEDDKTTNEEALKAQAALQEQAKKAEEERAKRAEEEKALRKQEQQALEEVMKIVNDDYSYLEEVPADDGNILNLTQGNDNYAILYTDNGNIVIELYPDDAPNTVKAFKNLVRSGFYNGTEFFKVLPDYIAQAGDPTSSGYGGTGKKRNAEISERNFDRGTVAMANQDNLHSDDSQFFISFNSFPWLDKKYTIFGKVVSGMGILENLPASYKNDGISENPLTINKIMIASDVAKAAVEEEKEKADTTGLQNDIPVDVTTAAPLTDNKSKTVTDTKNPIDAKTTTKNNASAAATTKDSTANTTNNGRTTNSTSTTNNSAKTSNGRKTSSTTTPSSSSTATTQSSSGITQQSNSAGAPVGPTTPSQQMQNGASTTNSPTNGTLPPLQIAPRDNSTSLYGNFGK